MEKTIEFIIYGKELRSFVKKYQPSHLAEISSDEDVLLKIKYEETRGKITDIIDIQTKSLNSTQFYYFNASFAYALIRYVIPSFYGLKSSPNKFAHSEEKIDLLPQQFKIINHLKAHDLLKYPIPEHRLQSSTLLKQSEEYKISSEEIRLLPTIHALEVNIKIYEERAESRWYKQSDQRIISIEKMRALMDEMKENIISENILPSQLIEMFIDALKTQIAINLKDHETQSHFGFFYKWRIPKLVEIYQETLTFLSETPTVSKKTRKSL